MSHHDHEETARQVLDPSRVRCAVLTCSDTRTSADDRSGDLIATLLEAAGHTIATRRLTREDPGEIARHLDALLAEPIELLICTGGTGIGSRDGTIEPVEERLTTALPGFGELFRSLSHEEIGAAAMLSRATGGVVRNGDTATLLFALPGSTAAVALGMNRLIIPQIRHMRLLLGDAP